MSEFRDDDLGRRLGAAAGADPDLGDARQSVRRRLVRARRRRAAMVTSGAAALVVALGVVATLRNGPDEHIQTSSPDVTTPAGTNAPETTDSATTVSSTSVLTSTTAVSTTTTGPRESATTIPGSTTAPTTPGVQPTTPSTPTTTSTPAGLPDDTSSTTTAAPSTSIAPVDETETYTSDGGSITVRFSGGQLQLLASPSTAGYSKEVHTNKADDIEVRFAMGNQESRIRVRIIDGQMQRTE